MRSNRFRGWLWVTFAVLFSFNPALRAQLVWDPVASPTSQNLWGVCFGGGQFVAVGEGGTILTSTDGASWTARNSGTTAWLTGVTFANQLYVAVGSEGTIVTSSDGFTWRLRASGGPRLNGVGYGNGRFIAVGEQGVVQVSIDGTTWSPGNVGVNGWLRGIIFAEGRFLITGQDGLFFTTTDGKTFTNASFSRLSIEAVDCDDGYYAVVGALGMFYTSTDSKNWIQRNVFPNRDAYLRGVGTFNNTLVVVGNDGLIAYSWSHQAAKFIPVTIPSTAQFNAIAASTSIGVTVGSSGTILRSLPASSPPQFTEAPIVQSGSLAYVGSHVTFVAKASGSGPMAYQWSFNGAPIAGATSFKLELDVVSLAQSGAYSVVATNPRGSATAPLVTLSVSPLPANDAVDPTFVSSLNGPPTTTEPIVVVAPDGKIFLGGPYTNPSQIGSNFGVVRLTADGSVDPSFKFADAIGTPSQILLQPSGKIIVNGGVRLNPDGSVDPTFGNALLSLRPAMILLPDGRLIALTLSGNGTSLVATRLSLEGSIDPSFPAVTIPLPGNYSISSVADFAPLQTTDSAGRVVAAIPYLESGTSTLMLRLYPDGQPDVTFGLRRMSGKIRTLQVLGLKVEYALVTNFSYSSTYGVQSELLARLNADGSDDASFHQITYTPTSRSIYIAPTLPRIPLTTTFTPDGGAIVVTESDYSGATGPLNESVSVDRYDSSGTKISGSSLLLSDQGLYIRKLIFLPNGQLIAAGDFTSLNGVPTSKVARLNLTGKIYETQLTNLSIRTRAGNADQKLIAGFVVGGTSGATPVIGRGIGPQLATYGVAGTLADPRVDLYSGTTLLASNDDWNSQLSASFAAVGAFPLVANGKDAAINPNVGPGVYSLQVSGASSSTGVALAEIYDAGPAPTGTDSPRFVNLSGRALVGTGDDALIAGFVVRGTGIKRLLIRAVGPTLGTYGVSEFLAMPELAVYRGSEVVAVATASTTFASKYTATGIGAFALASNNDAALVIDVSPGVYSAEVRGKNGTTGVALVEIYEVP